jgi:hypothetical protein
MASTFTIPLTTLTVGSHDLGPSSVPDADSRILLSIDRTAVNGAVQGLNGQPPATQISMTTFQSDDGGATWQELGANTVVGGIFTKGGTQINTDHVGTQLAPGTGRQVRATVVVTGASVAVAGTLTTS